MNQIAADNNFNVPAVIGAARRSPSSSRPAVPGRLPAAGWDAPDGESGTMANGKAAMDLMGQWAPGASRTSSASNLTEDLPFELGWFPFPEVEGGAERPLTPSVAETASPLARTPSPEAVDFLGFITNTENQRTWGTNSGRP